MDGFSQTPEMITELAQNAAAPQVGQAPGGGDAVGKVEVAKGNAFIVQADGTRVPAKIGQPIFQGDTVETDAEGSIGLVFADNSTFSLADQGRMVIDEMVYDAGSQEGTSVFNVAQGVFTFVSGQIAKTDVDAMVIKTATSTIGIRGTSGGGRAAPEGETNTFTLFADPDGNVGEATVTTQVGTQILNQVNQTTLIKSAFQPPSRPVVMPPQVVEKFYAKAAQALPPSPVTSSGANEGGDQTEGNEEGATEGQVEGEGTQEGEAEQAADGEGAAQGEQQAEGEGPVDGQPEGLAEGQTPGIPGEGQNAQGGEPLAGQPNGVGPDGQPADDGGQIEQAGFAAADEAARQALAGGASVEQAQQIGQQAALDAAVAEARTQGITDAEINAATTAFDQALADGASLEDAFFAAGGAADSAGRKAAVQFDEQQAQLAPTSVRQEISTVQVAESPDGSVEEQQTDNNDGGSNTGQNADFQTFDDFGQVFGDPYYDPLISDFGYGPEYGPIEFQNYEIYSALNGGPGPDEFQRDDDDGPPPVVNEFGEYFTDFSAGNDVRIGNNANTRFEMSVFGGNDTVTGNGGTDEIAFINLSNAYGVYDSTGATPIITFQDGDTSTSGSVTMTSVEQIYASIPGGDKFRVNAEDSNGYGIVYAGDSGNDTIDVSAGTLSFSNHSSENFDLSANAGSILGTILFGADGNDTITGVSAKENQVYGGTGNDTLTGGSAGDTLDGGTGNDSLYGGAGNDSLYGGTDDDFVHGGTGNDELFGGTGDDYLSGAAGDDTAEGNAGADTLIGGAGNDTLSGGAGADDVQGGNDNDYLFGNDGADTLTGGTGSDSLTGGDGSDRFVFSGAGASGLGTDTLTDFSGATAFGGGTGNGDSIQLDTSNLSISSIAYEEITWDGTTGTLNLTNANASVIVLTGAAGTQTDALTALVAGNAAGHASSGDAVILFHNSGNNDQLSMIHTDDAASGSANVYSLAQFSGVTDTSAAANLDSADFSVQA